MTNRARVHRGLCLAPAVAWLRLFAELVDLVITIDVAIIVTQTNIIIARRQWDVTLLFLIVFIFILILVTTLSDAPITLPIWAELSVLCQLAYFLTTARWYTELGHLTLNLSSHVLNFHLCDGLLRFFELALDFDELFLSSKQLSKLLTVHVRLRGNLPHFWQEACFNRWFPLATLFTSGLSLQLLHLLLQLLYFLLNLAFFLHRRILVLLSCQLSRWNLLLKLICLNVMLRFHSRLQIFHILR